MNGLTDIQRQELCFMLGAALIEIRRLAWHEGQAEQAGCLADAFHNVPTEMWQSHFQLTVLRDSYLREYQNKFANNLKVDFVEWVENIISLGNGN